MPELKTSRAWIAAGAALFAVSVALMYCLSLRPVTAIFRCERLTEDRPGECRLEESYVFWPDKAVSFQESALRGAERIQSLPEMGGYGDGPVQVGLRLTSGQIVPIIGPDWPFVAETSIQRINVYLADRSALSLVIKPYCLTSLYLFCDLIAALLLIGVVGCSLPRKQPNKYEGAYDGLYDRRKP